MSKPFRPFKLTPEQREENKADKGYIHDLDKRAPKLYAHASDCRHCAMERDLDKRARNLGWHSNAEMTHQSHKKRALGCEYCANDARFQVDPFDPF